MKTTLFILILAVATAARAYNINWNHFSDQGTFVVGNDFKSLGTGKLPPNNTQPTENCAAKPLLINTGFTVTCGREQWAFEFSRFSCAIGGGGKWVSPDGSTGAFICGQ